MLVNDQFAFIHVHKTGGRTLNSVITQCVPGSRMVGYHYPIAEMPADQRHLPIVGVVRNPWDWYVSWYAFNRKMGLVNPLFVVVSDGGKADFKTTIRQLVTLGDDSEQSRIYRDALAASLPDAFGSDRGAGLTRACIEGFSEPQRGYYSWLFKRMLGDGSVWPLHVAKFENLHADFIEIMQSLGVAETEKLAAVLNATEKKNSSSHSHYANYYDDELRDLIAEREREMIETYGYAFDASGRIEHPLALPQFYSHDLGFRKLLDRSRNFLLLRSDVDIGPLRAKIEQISEQEWSGSGREARFNVHRHTRSLSLISDDFKHLPPTRSPIYQRFAKELQPILDTIASFYGGDGIVLRALLVNLSGGEVIDPHFDIGMSLMHSHRVHVPIITHEQVKFCVGGEKRHLAAGEMWEINNATVHQVENFSDHERVHLIVDWAPMATITHRERLAAPARAASPPPPPTAPMVARNAPCPCGSGERYKNCHGKLA